MALLVFLSGLLLEPSLRKGWRAYLDGKARRIFYPYLLWTLIFYFTIYEGPNDHTVWIGASYLWFILFLFIYYCVSLATTRISPAILAVAALVASYCMPDGTKYYEQFFYLMGMFFLGHAAGRSEKLLNLASNRIAVTVSIPLMFLLVGWNWFAEDIKYKAEWAIPTLAGFIVFIYLAKSFAGHHLLRPLEYMGEHSLVFYVCQTPLIYLVMDLTLKLGIASVPLISLISFLIVFPVCVVAAELARTNKVIGLLFSIPRLIPMRNDHDPWAHWRSPRDMMRHG